MTDTVTERIIEKTDNIDPKLVPFYASETEINDLLLEARNWADGTKLASQEQADEVGRLIVKLRAAVRTAGERLDTETKPHNEALTEIRGRYNPLIGDASKKGSAILAMAALKRTADGWLLQLQAEKDRLAKIARDEADKAAEAARKAFAESQVTDLAAREQAEELLDKAKEADKAARQVEKSKVQLATGGRAIGLRTTTVATIVDRKAVLRFYAATKGDALEAFLKTLVDADCRAKVFGIPGVEYSQKQEA